MAILVEKPGILTTVQDLGRTGYRRLGINPGGAMDRTAARLVNILLGNDESESLIEMHFPAAHMAFKSDAIIALGGADFGAELDGKPLDNCRPIFAAKNSTLGFTKKNSGHRAYLAVMGGFKLEKWLGSASTNLTACVGGVGGRKLVAGDILELRQLHTRPKRDISHVKVSSSLLPFYSRFPTLRVLAGAEYQLLLEVGRELLTGQDLTITNASDRMGFRLSGEPISLSNPLELLSSAVDFGTIQLLPDGQLIVLMADHQTTGGYPRIAHVISQDLPLMAQLGPGDKVGFHLIEHAEAEQLAADFERELRFFRVGCKFLSQTWTN